MRTHERVVAVCCFLLICAASLTAFDRQSNADYRARRLALADKVGNSVVVLFAAMESEEGLSPFRQDNNFYYLSGSNEPGAALLIAPSAPATEHSAARPYTEILFLPAHNFRKEKWTGPKLGPEDPKAPEITGFDRVEPLDKMRDELANLVGMAPVYTDVVDAPEESPSTRPLQWLARANAFPFSNFEDVKPLIGELREHKDAGELALIRHATEASKAAHRKMLKTMRPGLTENQIAGLMVGEFEFHGCERPAYAPIVGAGFNSTVLHYSANSGTIHDGDIVVMDVAGEYSMYASDITRTVPANGHFTPRQREIYEIVLGAQRAVMQAFVSGKSVLRGQGPDSLYKVAYDYINTHGKDLHGQPLGKYFIHGLGHPVGLEVHDYGTSGPNIVLGPAMVFTIEPGIYIPEEKIGVRIEDIYEVDKSGKLIDLTGDLPHTADEVEAAMKP
ncbi:MAG TPA: aminopeptidase P N-terminal domain-containing protein [candidate division Zixibacteria bacterium]|nr:aminopeptidase P N-terminal domain-containing protein [candidate division Zixibacteria bacterium]